MMKKLTALCGALVPALSLSACGGTATQLPALVLEDPAASSAASQVSGTESGSDHFQVPHLAGEITQVVSMPNYATMEKIIAALT